MELLPAQNAVREAADSLQGLKDGTIVDSRVYEFWNAPGGTIRDSISVMIMPDRGFDHYAKSAQPFRITPLNRAPGSLKMAESGKIVEFWHL